jgi:hypothetical protein
MMGPMVQLSNLRSTTSTTPAFWIYCPEHLGGTAALHPELWSMSINCISDTDSNHVKQDLGEVFEEANCSTNSPTWTVLPLQN